MRPLPMSFNWLTRSTASQAQLFPSKISKSANAFSGFPQLVDGSYLKQLLRFFPAQGRHAPPKEHVVCSGNSPFQPTLIFVNLKLVMLQSVQRKCSCSCKMFCGSNVVQLWYDSVKFSCFKLAWCCEICKCKSVSMKYSWIESTA